MCNYPDYYHHSGSRSGLIHQHDVRVANHHLNTLRGHTQEVCGLTWSPDGRYLASGGNDNLLNIWTGTQGADQTHLYSFTQHQGAVKVGVAHLLSHIFIMGFTQICFRRNSYPVLCRRWRGVRGSQTSWHQEEEPVTATFASGTSAVAFPSLAGTRSLRWVK